MGGENPWGAGRDHFWKSIKNPLLRLKILLAQKLEGGEDIYFRQAEYQRKEDHTAFLRKEMTLPLTNTKGRAAVYWLRLGAWGSMKGGMEMEVVQSRHSVFVELIFLKKHKTKTSLVCLTELCHL